jgi:hypothetical protein
MADVVGHLARDEQLSLSLTGRLEICTDACMLTAIPSEHASEFLGWGHDVEGGVSRTALLRFFEMTGLQPSPHIDSTCRCCGRADKGGCRRCSAGTWEGSGKRFGADV